MDDLRIVFWIIVGIIYIITKVRKKQQPIVPKSEPKPSEPELTDRPLTFDELLREIQAAKPKPQPVLKKPEYVDYDDGLEEEKKPIEKTDFDYRNEDQIYETYERAKQEAFHRPSMEETLKLENTVVRFGQFKNYTRNDRPSLAAEYANDLRDPENFRKAFILSEILNRRF
ncbi:MAG TPA: hypothetical protein DGG95_14365 [Cytophagales bacterium]|jgi:hypothetical protein|nr:hypothetical protein [Cytophagales bacterium]